MAFFLGYVVILLCLLGERTQESHEKNAAKDEADESPDVLMVKLISVNY